MIDVREELTRIIHKYLPGCKIMLFGSRARGTQQDGADYDIAIDAGKKILSEVMYKITSDIEESNVYVHVDVVDVHGVTPEFLAVIEKDWVIWKKNNSQVRSSVKNAFYT
ncbi:MAG: uncharacterized protein QG632_207 [Candidatus Dependentiae bacterium]|nr:uncharacterized protein [Candidatus Dependentiae bacterium]